MRILFTIASLPALAIGCFDAVGWALCESLKQHAQADFLEVRVALWFTLGAVLLSAACRPNEVQK